MTQASLTTPTPGHLTRPPTSARSLAPDLARGFMLLAIAATHVPFFLSDWDQGPALLDDTAKFLRTLLFDNQARTMFVLLFGYGLGQLLLRRRSRGFDWTSTRKLMRRRSLWLIVIGGAHAVLLIPLDIISVYGLALLLFAAMVRARASVLLWTSAATFFPGIALLLLPAIAQGDPAGANDQVSEVPSFFADDYLAHLGSGLVLWPLNTIGGLLTVVPAMLLGILAARRRILDAPERHAALLRRIAIVSAAVAVIGRLPYALNQSGVWSDVSEPVRWTAVSLHTVTGFAGGIAMTALIGLIAIRLDRRERGPITTAMTALGQRSMTFYIFQSLVFLVLFYPFTLDLSGSMGFAAGSGLAVAIWVVSLVAAEWMRRIGYRGPAELMLRRLSDRA